MLPLEIVLVLCLPQYLLRRLNLCLDVFVVVDRAHLTYGYIWAIRLRVLRLVSYLRLRQLYLLDRRLGGDARADRDPIQ